MKLKHTLITLCSLLGSALTANAGTVSWGNSPIDQIYTSTGADIADSGAWTFALGTFGSSFTPDGSNLASWYANWKPLDSGTGITGGSAGNGNYTSPAPIFGGDYISDTFNLSLSGGQLLSSDSLSTFSGGEKVYTWIYNSTSMTPGAEWGLFTDASWSLPTSTNPDDIALFNAQWRLDGPGSSLSVTPIWGSLYNSTSATGADFISNDMMGTSNFGLQTATVTAVPEPSSVLLLATCGLVVLFRHRRLCS